MNRPDIHFMIITLLFQIIMVVLICYDWEKTERKFKIKKIIVIMTFINSPVNINK